MSKHTPGPWRLAGCDRKDQVISPRGSVVALVNRVTTLDAHLIAAAPDIKDLLQEWYGLTRRYLDDPAESYEELAAEFRADTGLMAPGKDDPFDCGGRYEERRAAWKGWNDAKLADRMERTRAALAKAEGVQGE